MMPRETVSHIGDQDQPNELNESLLQREEEAEEEEKEKQQEVDDDEEDEEEEENGELQFTLRDWVSMVVPWVRGHNYRDYVKGRELIEDKLDITRIMKKVEEFEMFKRMMLDEQQCLIFDHIPKPSLGTYDEKQKTSFFKRTIPSSLKSVLELVLTSFFVFRA